MEINFLCAVFAILCKLCNGLNTGNIEEKFRWKSIDFEFDSEQTRKEAIESGDFIQENNIPFGVEVWGDKVFVTIPRRNPGVPSTLNYINLSKYSNTVASHFDSRYQFTCQQ